MCRYLLFALIALVFAAPVNSYAQDDALSAAIAQDPDPQLQREVYLAFWQGIEAQDAAKRAEVIKLAETDMEAAKRVALEYKAARQQKIRAFFDRYIQPSVPSSSAQQPPADAATTGTE